MLELGKPLIIGALHLPRYGRCNPKTTMSYLEDYVCQNCRVFVDNGMDTLYIQDENPAPDKATEETIAVVSALGRLLKREFATLKLGVIVEAHDGTAPIAIAHACGADFVRIKVFAGAMIKAAGIQNACGIEAVQYRSLLGTDVAIFADAHDRTGYPLAPIPIETIANWVDRIGADAIILTGMTYAQSLEYLDTGRGIIKHTKPIVIGGSVTIENIGEVLKHCDGVVVSTSLMLDNEPEGSMLHWDGGKIRRFMDAVQAAMK